MEFFGVHFNTYFAKICKGLIKSVLKEIAL